MASTARSTISAPDLAVLLLVTSVLALVAWAVCGVDPVSSSGFGDTAQYGSDAGHADFEAENVEYSTEIEGLKKVGGHGNVIVRPHSELHELDEDARQAVLAELERVDQEVEARLPRCEERRLTPPPAP